MSLLSAMMHFKQDRQAADRQLLSRLGTECLAARCRISTAESCTGGGIAEQITRVPGSSAWFECGFVVYSNAAKQQLLGVPARILECYGAVSEESALAMARGAFACSRASLVVAVTGIAGPDGDGRGKPVGTVCFAWLSGSGQSEAAMATTVQFSGDREAVRDDACRFALNGLLRRVAKGAR